MDVWQVVRKSGRYTAWGIVVTLALLLLAPRPISAADPVPEPLPRECGGINPGELPPACCAYGYVYWDGGPVEGATVTVAGPGGSVDVITQPGEFSDDPYFAVDLSGDPVAARTGDTITLSVSYGGRSRTLTYQVVADGQQVDLVLPANTSDTPIYYVSGSSDNRQIWRMNGDGTNRTYIRDGQDPNICPVDGRVLYSAGDDIHVMDINGNYIANLTPESDPPGSYTSVNPAWSPDCSQIAYAVVYPGWRYYMVKMNADGSNKTLLPSPGNSSDEWFPKWSPDGQWIVFTARTPSNNKDNLFRMRPDGSEITQLTFDEGWYPSWSPDGTRIAYVSHNDIYMMNADGSNQHPITFYSPSGGVSWWSWWVSDRRLLHVPNAPSPNNDMDIWLVNDDGSGVLNLTNDGHSYYRSPTVRPTYPPVATIHSITPDIALWGRDTITFRGSGQDGDEGGDSIVAYRWWSSLDGKLSDRATFTLTASSLSTGTHTIYFQVQDDDVPVDNGGGDWSPVVWRTLYVTDEPFDLDALVLTNRERLAALYGEAQADAVMQKLDELAAATNGIVIRVEEDPTTAAAYAAWLAEPTSFSRANAVTEAIHDQIVAHLGLSPDLAYLVIVGDDRVIPFRRVRDRTGYPEHLYRQVPADTTTGAALAADRILTDDFYADRVPTIPDDPAWDGHPLYLPDMAVGRLIETPEEIIGQIDQFLADGEIEVEMDGAIVTGYDLLTDSAQEMCSALLADGLYPNCGLIGNSWSATQFHNEVLNRRHALASYNGHADHGTIYTPQGSISSEQVLNSAGDHSGTLLWTPGCHGGLNVPPETSAALDVPQAWAARQALLVGNTGYGWGYRLGIGYSEQLMLNYTQELLAGGQTTVGRALVEAKQRYYLDELDFDYTDEKILIEATLYGLPMTRVLSPDEQLSATAPLPTLRRATVEYTGVLTIEHVSRQFPALLAEETEWGTFYSYEGQAERSDGAPVQPRAGEAPSPEMGTPHGAVLRGAQGEELPDFDPVVEEATWEVGSGGEEPVFDSPAWFPGRLLRLNRMEEQSNLVIALGQFQGSSAVQRLYEAMDMDIFYSSSGDWQPPHLWTIESGQQGSVVVLSVAAEDDSGIHSVVVAYNDGRGNWSSVELVQGGSLWHGDFPGDAGTEFFVQVVDGAGNVTVYPWNGRYMQPGDSYHFSQVFLPLVVR